MPTSERPQTLQISRHIWEQMRLDVASRAPEEACGLLAGRRQEDQLQASLLFITTNLLHSPTRYRIDPQEQLAAFNRMDDLGLELVAIYHSHPQGPDAPSPTDLAEAYYPEAAYLIWSGRAGEWVCAGYAIQHGRIFPVSLQLVETQT